MNINYKKSAKLILLLISTLLIATASAATFRYMYIDGSVTVGAAKFIWIEGLDSPGDATISGSTYTVDFDVEPGTPRNFTECVFLKNNDTEAHNMTISVTTTISATDFTECKMHIYENSTTSWVFVDTLDITTSDSYETYTGNDPLQAGEYYQMTFEVVATVGASGTYDFDIQVEYE
ncbi:MAG: hypothetical protein OEY24_01920 [Candidatus Bathyarchaeota archaeon]|nr:hypothetical protein [Candidatus Bathyarchaeota archaeon]MDH5494447.1 hypothetical protein [Candidatus Bathyarchaeota archaeon]